MTNTTEEAIDWKICEINTQSPGPRYVINGPTKAAVGTVTFNGMKVDLGSRAEVEYRRLEIIDEGYPRGRTANFYDHDE